MNRDEIIQMDAKQMRLAIAKAKGWTFFEMDKGQGYDNLQMATPVGMYPDCVGYGFKVHEIDNPRENVVFEFDFDGDGISHTNWTTSIADAMELLGDFEEWAIHKIDERYMCQAIEKQLIEYNEDVELPLAICRVWLVMHIWGAV